MTISEGASRYYAILTIAFEAANTSNSIVVAFSNGSDDVILTNFREDDETSDRMQSLVAWANLWT